MNFQTMHRQRKFILIAATAGVISMFLPWVSISAFGMDVGQNSNGLKGIGILIFFVFAAILVMAVINNHIQPLSRLQWFLALAGGILTLLLTLSSFAGGADDLAFGVVEAKPGIGLWLSVVSSICIVIGAWAYKRKDDTLKSGFDQIKTRFASGTGNINITKEPSVKENAGSPSVNKIQELERLISLKDQGHITEPEFNALKAEMNLNS